jgi:hypothetical protein
MEGIATIIPKFLSYNLFINGIGLGSPLGFEDILFETKKFMHHKSIKFELWKNIWLGEPFAYYP